MNDASDLWGAINDINQDSAAQQKAQEDAKKQAEAEAAAKQKAEQDKNEPFTDPFSSLLGDIDGVNPSNQPPPPQQVQRGSMLGNIGQGIMQQNQPQNGGNPYMNNQQNMNGNIR